MANEISIFAEIRGAREAVEDLGRIKQGVRDVGDQAKKSSRDTDGLGNSSSKMGDKMVAATARARTGFEGLGRAIGKIKRYTKIATGAVTALVGWSVKQGLSFNAAFENAEIGFTTLLGSTKKAREMMDDLRDVSGSTSLRFTQVLEGSQYLVSMGMNAKRVKPLLTGLNNALIASGKGAEAFDDAAETLGVIQSEGTLSKQTFLQLSRVTPNLGKIMRKEFGLSAEQLQNIGREGISSERVMTALTKAWSSGDIAKAGERSAKAFSTQLTNMRKNFEQLQRLTTKPLFDKLRLDVFPVVLKTQSRAMKAFSQNLERGGVQVGFNALFLSMDRTLGLNLTLYNAWRELQSIAEDLWAVLSQAVVPAFQAIGSVTGDILSPLALTRNLLGWAADNAEKLKPVIIGLVAVWVTWRTALIASTIVQGISNALTLTQTVLTGGLAAAQKATAKSTGKLTVAQKVLNAVMSLNPWGIAITAAIALGIVIWQLWKRSDKFRAMVTAVGEAAVAAFNWFLDVMKSVWDWISGHWQTILMVLTGPIGAAVAVIVKHWGTIQSGVGTLIAWIKGAWSGVASAIAAPFQAAWRLIQPILSKIEAAIRKIKSWLPGQVSSEQAMASLQDIRRRQIEASGDNLPGVPGRATGGRVTEPFTLVGERGPEVVSLPRGSYVHTAGQTRDIARRRSQPIVVNVQVDRRTIARAVVDELNAVGARA